MTDRLSGQRNQRLSSWRCHAGDVSFIMTAADDWLRAQREHLAQYLPPPPGELELEPVGIRVHTDDRLFREVEAAIAASPSVRRIEPVPGVVMLEARRDDGGRAYSIAEDAVEGLPGAYAVTAEGRQIGLYLHSRTGRPHRYPIRIIREAMLRTYEDAGGIVFHAAGVDIGGAGVLICGPGGAGKTTVASALLRHPDTTLLSGDRVIIIADQRMVAVPLPIRAAAGTISAFTELRAIAGAEVAAQAGTSQPHATFGTSIKRAYTPSQFAGAFRSGVGSASALRLVIMPELMDAAEPASLEWLRGARALPAIAGSCFTPRDEFWTTPWLIPRHTPDSTLRLRADAAVGVITAKVPCARIRFGVRGSFSGLEDALKAAIEDIG